MSKSGLKVVEKMTLMDKLLDMNISLNVVEIRLELLIGTNVNAAVSRLNVTFVIRSNFY